MSCSASTCPYKSADLEIYLGPRPRKGAKICFRRLVFLSNVVPGDDLQHVISQALAVSKLTIILATKTYGQRTNGLFDTSSEMNYVIGQAKPYYLIRMIPSNEAWAEPHVTMAFPSSIMYKLWMPGDPMPWDLLHELSALLMPASAAAGAAPSPA